MVVFPCVAEIDQRLRRGLRPEDKRGLGRSERWAVIPVVISDTPEIRAAERQLIERDRERSQAGRAAGHHHRREIIAGRAADLPFRARMRVRSGGIAAGMGVVAGDKRCRGERGRTDGRRGVHGLVWPEKIAPIRDRWKGKIVLKGVASEIDAEMAIKLGLDGIIVSNHGGRQLDAGQSSIKSLHPIVERYAGKVKIMMDSGLRSGPDVARALASGAEFVFLGRSFMYGVAALGEQGGDHTIGMLKTQLKQVMEQVGCGGVGEFWRHLVS